MPKDAFWSLSEEKRALISLVSKEEFINYGYQNASTNRIVKNCGISKGSLFYYFSGKEDLYLYLLDEARNKFSKELKHLSTQWSSDILERIKIMTEVGLNLFEENPLDYRLLMSFNDRDLSNLRDDYIKQVAEKEKANFANMFENINSDNFSFDVQTTIQVVLWLYIGIKVDISSSITKDTKPAELRKSFMEKLDMVLESLKKGIYQSE